MSTSVTQKQQVEPHFKDIPINHFGKHGNTSGSEEYRMPHPVWYTETKIHVYKLLVANHVQMSCVYLNEVRTTLYSVL